MNDGNGQGAALVCFAMPDESRLFTAQLERRRTVRGDRRHPLPTVLGELRGRPITVVHTGVGDSAAAREHLARTLANEASPPRLVISAGYAGALGPDLAVGDLVLGENFSSPALQREALPRLVNERVRLGVLLTESATIESAAAKHALHTATGALAVDMETAWIAAACAASAVPLLSLRVISDAADQDFPVPGRVLYDAVRQRPRLLALPAWLAMHPRQIAPFARFVLGLGPARERLTRALQIVLTPR